MSKRETPLEVNRYEVREVHEALAAKVRTRVEAGAGPDGAPRWGYVDTTTPDDEAAAAAKLAEWTGAVTTLANGATVPVLNIITSEPMSDFVARVGGYQETFGTTSASDPDGPKRPHHNRLEAVVEIEIVEGSKVVEFEPDVFARVATKRYVASSAPYTVGGRRCTDSCASGPERFERAADGTVRQVGAATALLLRLTEAIAHG